MNVTVYGVCKLLQSWDEEQVTIKEKIEQTLQSNQFFNRSTNMALVFPPDVKIGNSITAQGIVGMCVCDECASHIIYVLYMQ